MLRLDGIYQHPASTAQQAAVLTEPHAGWLQIQDASSDEILWQGDDYQADELLPGLPLRLSLGNGGCFETSQTTHLPSRFKHHAKLAGMERSTLLALLAIVLIPLICGWAYLRGIPALAYQLVPYVPSSVVTAIDEQTVYALDNTMLNASTLPQQRQNQLREQWMAAIAELGRLTVPVRRIEFRDAPEVGANAFALPGGTIVVTDQLVELLKDQPDALLAVLLHELGHVQHQHGLKMLTQSAANAVILAVALGDLSAMQEVVVGSATSMAQASFSREFEGQADQFAHQQLTTLGKSPTAFADALKALAKAHDIEPGDEEGLLSFFSSHPAIAERIKNASN